MPSHHRHHAHSNSPHGGPGQAQWIYSAEESLAVTEIGKLLVHFGESLITSRRIALRRDVDVTPPDPCPMLVRFELTPKGHKLLKLELKWGEEFTSNGGDSLAALIVDEPDTPSVESANTDGGEVV